MRQRTARVLYRDLNRGSEDIRCAIHGCGNYPYVGMYVCFIHGLHIVRDFQDVMKLDASIPRSLREEFNPPTAPVPDEPAFVYYLMIGPETVKIGTTRQLATRMEQLRTEMQYVVALERGSYELERQRHREFADERIGKREHFRITPRLRQHIAELVPQRDELMIEATTRRNTELIADLGKR